MLAGLLLLPGCCAKRESAPQPPALYAIEIIPIGVRTNIFIPPAPGRKYGIVTDNLGMLYLQGLLPEEEGGGK